MSVEFNHARRQAISNPIVSFDEEAVKSELRELVRKTIEETINAMFDEEADQLVGAGPYERTDERGFTTTSGRVTLKMPKLKDMRFATAVIERCKRHETSVEEAIIEMYLTGVSIRRIEDVDAYLTTHIEAEDPMTKLVTDVTEFKVGSTKLYLSPVVDLYNDEVVACSISRPPNMKMVLEMLAGPEGGLNGEDAPCCIRHHGLAVPDVHLQTRARADGDRPVHVPQRKLPRQCES